MSSSSWASLNHIRQSCSIYVILPNREKLIGQSLESFSNELTDSKNTTVIVKYQKPSNIRREQALFVNEKVRNVRAVRAVTAYQNESRLH